MKSLRRVFLPLLAFVLAGQVGLAQDALNMSLLSNYGRGEGESKGVFAAGSLVFYGLGAKVQVASFSDPANPVKIGSAVVSDVVECLVRTSISSTQYVVASGGTKMWLINVQDPTRPSLVSTTDVAPGTTCEGIATSGSYAYVAAGGAGLKIYNISTPATPTLVASIDSLAYCENVVISAPYAYVAAGTRSYIVDISTPSAPVVKGRMAGYGGYHQAINVRSGYVFICNYDAGLQVVNATDPANPVNVVAVPSGYRTASIVFDGNYAYVAVGDSGLWIYNVVNPASPVIAGKIVTTGRAAYVSYGAITVGGVPKGHIYVSNRNPAPGLSAINVSVPETPTLSAFVAAVPAPTGSAFSPFYANGKVYVAYGSAGLRILDVSNPSAISLLSTRALGGESRGVVVAGNYAYVAAMDSGVHMVNVTDPANPSRVKSFNTSRTRGIAINGNYVYAATRDSGLVIFDVTAPDNPLWLTSVRGIDCENVTAAGSVAGVSFYNRLQFYNITNPASPVAGGYTPNLTIGNEGFAISGNYAYVPDGDSLKIFNISNVSAPTLLSKIRTTGYGYNAAVMGNFCYVASEGTGVRAVNITNPAVPVEVGHYDGVPQSRGIAVGGGKYVYVAEKLDGISVYSNDLATGVIEHEGPVPNTIALHQNFPNPFNPSTAITLDLPERAFVTLEVFDLLGQRVALLLNRQVAAGTITVQFNASAFPSGLYLYRAQANGFTATRKMLLVK